MIHAINHSDWCFVFGSNLAGRHGKGAALTAQRHYGAEHGFGHGHHGMSYAIPTKDAELNPLSLSEIRHFAETFKEYAKNNPFITFQLTRVGCGLAGFRDELIAPLFFDVTENVLLPRRWERMRQPDNVFRLIVAGSRSLSDYQLIESALTSLLRLKTKSHLVQIVSGGARGADALGERFAIENGLELIQVPAAWDVFGKSAGHLRNEAMAWMSDAVVAFWDGRSPGTRKMIDIAKREEICLRTRFI